MKHIKTFVSFVLLLLLSAAAVFADAPYKIDIHGYLSQGFLFSNKNNYLAKTSKGSFHFNELGINFSTDINDKLRVGIQLAARDLGDLGNNKVMVDWVYADYHMRDWLGFRVGLIKMPIGIYNKTRDLDMLRPSILLPQSIYSETYRDTSKALKGVGVYGTLSLDSMGDISYELLFGSMNIDTNSSIIKAAEARGDNKVEKYDVDTIYGGAIIWETPLEGLRVGVSHESITMDIYGTLTKDMTVPVSFPPFILTIAPKGAAVHSELLKLKETIYSLEFTHYNLIFAAEYFRFVQHYLFHIIGAPSQPIDMDVESFYGSLSYRFSDFFQTGLYYSVFYRDRNDRDGSESVFGPDFRGFQKDLCLSLRFDLNTQWVFKVEGHLIDGVGLCFNQDNLNEDGVPEYDRHWGLLAAKMTFMF